MEEKILKRFVEKMSFESGVEVGANGRCSVHVKSTSRILDGHSSEELLWYVRVS